jgi:Asp-tRNA(Asn)/Glu-tRNA(Gln) amidotransferase A subunit family amidase
MKDLSSRPLAGLRIGVKDLYFLRGVHSGQGNRAHRECYPKSDRSSDIVKRIIEAGGVIVGMTKTAEFGGTQEVVGDWTDYSYSFNSRGDGYLVAVGSSTGSASALTAYPWLDITIGSDGLPALITLKT